MATPFMNAARALIAVTAVALVADASLGALTASLGALGSTSGGPWWVAGHLPERGRWLVLALLLVPLARRLSAGEPAPWALSNAAVWQLVARLALLLPLVWIVALWIVQAALFTVAGRWDIDGQIFLSGDYYRRIFAGYAPWLLGGTAALVGSRHVE